MTGTHCDECDTWSLAPKEHGFIKVHWDGSELDFCSTDCLLRAFARWEPVTVIES